MISYDDIIDKGDGTFSVLGLIFDNFEKAKKTVDEHNIILMYIQNNEKEKKAISPQMTL